MLFTKTDDTTTLVKYPRKAYVKFWLDDTINTVKTYYTSSQRYITRPNFLIRLIDMLNISPYMELEDLLEHLDNTALHKCNTMGVVTGNNVNDEAQCAIIHNTKEYYVYNKDVDYDYFDMDAIRYPSIKCICSNHKEIAIWHPYEYPLAAMDDLWFVYNIDPVVLGITYYKWLRRELDNGRDIDVARFIYEEVIIAAMDSIINIGLLNRYKAILENEALPEFVNASPMVVKDMARDLDKSMYWTYSKLRRKRDMLYTDIANTIVGYDSNLHDTIADIDDRYTVKQNGWIYDLVKYYWYSMFRMNYNSKQEKGIHTKLMKEYAYHKRAKWHDVSVNDLIEMYAKLGGLEG